MSVTKNITTSGQNFLYFFSVNCTSLDQGCKLATTTVKPIPKPAPPKRDFQDANPPKTLDDWYARYDPSVGMGIALTLGILLFYLLSKVAVKWVWKRIKFQLQHTKRFGKYFPVKDLPMLSLEEVQKIANEQGIDIPESLLITLTARGDVLAFKKQPELRRMSLELKKIHRKRYEIRRLSQEIERNLAHQSKKRLCFVDETIFPSKQDVVPITVNIIGATPNSSESCKLNDIRQKNSNNSDKTIEDSDKTIEEKVFGSEEKLSQNVLIKNENTVRQGEKDKGKEEEESKLFDQI